MKYETYEVLAVVVVVEVFWVVAGLVVVVVVVVTGLVVVVVVVAAALVVVVVVLGEVVVVVVVVVVGFTVEVTILEVVVVVVVVDFVVVVVVVVPEVESLTVPLKLRKGTTSVGGPRGRKGKQLDVLGSPDATRARSQRRGASDLLPRDVGVIGTHEPACQAPEFSLIPFSGRRAGGRRKQLTEAELATSLESGGEAAALVSAGGYEGRIRGFRSDGLIIGREERAFGQTYVETPPY